MNDPPAKEINFNKIPVHGINFLLCAKLRKGAPFGEGRAKLLELTGVLSVAEVHSISWKKDILELTELASKRWVKRWTMDQIAEYFAIGRTTVIAKIGLIKSDPSLVSDGGVRARVKLTKNKFIGGI